MRSSLLVKLTAFLIPLSIALTWAAPVSLASRQSTAEMLCQGNSNPNCVTDQIAAMEASDAADAATAENAPSAEEANEQAQNESMAEDSEQPEDREQNKRAFHCDTDTNILQLNDLAYQLGAENSSFIATEIYEPIGGFEQKITAGKNSQGKDIILSQVFWKFSCATIEESKWIDRNATKPEKVETEGGRPITINGYVPYEKGCPSKARDCSIVQIIIGQSGTAILKTYVALFYRWAAGIVGIIAVLVIVISGIQISADQGSGENLSAAKTRIFQAISGLVILFLASLILYTINPTFFK